MKLPLLRRGLGGFGFPVFEQDGNFSKTHFAPIKPVFAHIKLFVHKICGLEFVSTLVPAVPYHHEVNALAGHFILRGGSQ